MSEMRTVPMPQDIPGLRDILQIVPTDHLARPMILFNLACLLHARAESNDSIEDYNDGNMALREWIELTSLNDPELEDRLGLLDKILEIQYKKTNAITDINALVEAREKAATVFPCGHPSRPQYLHNFGRTLLLRSQKTSSEQDLHASIKILEETRSLVPEDQPDYLRYLETLGHAVNAYCDFTESSSDLDYLLQLRQMAVDLARRGESAVLGVAINNLAGAYYARYEITKSLEDLNNSLLFVQESIDLLPEGDIRRCKFLANLGKCYKLKFERSGMRSDFDVAIKAFSDAAEIAPTDVEKSSFQHDISMALWLRYEVTGSLEDLKVTITALEETVKSLPLDCHERLRVLYDLGLAYARLAESNGSSLLLDKAIQALKESSINGTDKLQQRALVAALTLRYGLDGSEADFTAAKAVSMEILGMDGNDSTPQSINAVNEAPRMNVRDSTLRSIDLNNFAKLYHYRFDKLKQPEDIDEAIRLGEMAVQFAPVNGVYRGPFLKGLGDAFRDRYRLTGSTDMSDLLSAVNNYATSVECAEFATTARIVAAIEGGYLAATKYPRRSYELLSTVINLLSLANPQVPNQIEKQLALSNLASVASDAAALCISCGQPVEVALELLELGRGITISSLLKTRNTLANLENDHPDLAARFKRNRDRCDGQQTRIAEKLSTSETAGRDGPSLELNEIIEIIRSQAGFENFLMGTSVAEMMSLAPVGPIVYINASRFGSDSFIITHDSVRHVSLKDLKYDKLKDYTTALMELLKDDCPMTHANKNAAMQEILEWLWDVAIEPTLEILGFQAIPKTEDAWPHIWWIPVGLLSLFPLHAAGYHAGGGRRTLDRVISSYVPTVSSLKFAQEKALRLDSTQQHEETLLLAIMADTSNQNRLPYVALEVAIIDQLLPTAVNRVSLANPTKNEVIQMMKQYSAVHFACHAELNCSPAESRILLSDWETDPFSVAEIASLKLGHTRFAYFSGCHTASDSDFRLLGEVVNMTGACQLAGFPTVIGTLWHVSDQACASVAESLYQTILTDGGTIDFRRAARGLHFAVRKEVLGRVSPLVWASYIHSGV
jgi:tetratricopeptide (TPR) repeat protein